MSNYFLKSFQGKYEKEDYGSVAYAFVNYYITIQRYHKYGLMNFVVPVVILSILAILVFLLPPDSGEKIGFSTTVLLALVVFMEILSSETPPTSDNSPTPAIAVFAMVSLILITVSTVTTVFTLFMHHRNIGLQSSMPVIIQRIFLFYLPMIVRLKPPGADRVPRFSDQFKAKVEDDDLHSDKFDSENSNLVDT